MQQFLDNLLSLGRQRLIILAAAAFAMIVTVVLGFAVISSPDRAPLYTGLSPNSAGAIQVALANSGFDAQVSPDQTTVSVPRTDLARARMAVAEQGIPIDGEPGWELFDEGNAMAMNSFMQRVNRLRAMEGELARSIQTLDDVQSARVHLVLPEREPFSRARPEPRASVIVRAAMGRAIERTQALAIRSLVSSSVPELSPEHVTVLTAKGETILGDTIGGGDVERPLQAARTSMEDRLARQVEDILSARVGAGNVRVRVNVDLTTAREIVVEELFDPEQQVVRSTETRSESRSELDDGGNVGVENNIPAALQEGGGDAARSNQENSGETVEYEIGTTRREIVREAGELERLSVAVLVNGIYSVDGGDVSFSDRTPEELAQLEELVRSAVGFNEARGDTVSVASLRFMDYSMEVGEPINKTLTERITENIVSILRGVLALIIVALVLILGVRPLLRQLRTEPEPAEPAVLDAPPADAVALAADQAEGDEGEAQAPPPPVPAVAEPQPRAKPDTARAMPKNMPGVTSMFDPDQDLEPHEYLETMGIRGRLTKARVNALRDAADERPDEVLRVLRSWLSAEAEA